MWVFLLFSCGKTTFLCMDKDRTLTYQRLIGFMTSFVFMVKSRSKSFFNTFGSSVQGYLWVKVLSNLIFDFLGCYLLCQGLLDRVIKMFISVGIKVRIQKSGYILYFLLISFGFLRFNCLWFSFRLSRV